MKQAIKVEPVTKSVHKVWVDDNKKLFIIKWAKDKWSVYDQQAYLRGKFTNRADAFKKAFSLLGGWTE